MDQLEINFGTPLRIVVETAPPPTIYAWLTISYENFSLTAKGDIMYTLPVDHLVKMQVAYKDAAGNAAKIDGAVSWTSSDAAVATATADPTDSTIVTVTPLGPTGQIQVTASADADLGTGVRELLTVADITIVAGEAVAGTITPVGEAVPQAKKK